MDKTTIFITDTEAKALRQNRMEQWRLQSLQNNIHKSKLLRLRELNHDANKFRQRAAARLKRLSMGGKAPRKSETVEGVRLAKSKTEIHHKGDSTSSAPCLLCSQIASLVSQYEKDCGCSVSEELLHDPTTTCFFKSDQEVEDFIENLKASVEKATQEVDKNEHAVKGERSDSATILGPDIPLKGPASQLELEEQLRALKIAQFEHDYVFGIRDKKKQHLRAQTAPVRPQLESKVDMFLRRMAEFNEQNPMRRDFSVKGDERTPWHTKTQSVHVQRQPRTERKEAMIAEVLACLGLDDKIDPASYFVDNKW